MLYIVCCARTQSEMCLCNQDHNNRMNFVVEYSNGDDFTLWENTTQSMLRTRRWFDTNKLAYIDLYLSDSYRSSDYRLYLRIDGDFPIDIKRNSR